MKKPEVEKISLQGPFKWEVNNKYTCYHEVLWVLDEEVPEKEAEEEKTEDSSRGNEV
jgi:hypothetical protein